ncbi:histidine kinase N-terminal 7TM domain-containing protein [Paenibacillus sp. GCM10027627]|uniref:histidine kinase N-terminal 7TM domain-containing diguanylate cyclase n=1 Tax=unclassified Paenibacillus TaxID=185978 RepID=UPI00362D1A87
MGTPQSTIITLIITAGVINIIMGIYVWFNRAKQPMTKSFIALSFLSAIYIFGAALEKSADSLQEAMLWIKVEYWGMPFLPPLSLLLIMYFLGMDRYLTRRLRISLFVIPLVTALLVSTSELHSFYYRSVTVSEGTSFLRVHLDAGPWYIIQGGYTFGCMAMAFILLLAHWKRMKSSYRLQHMTMMIGLLLPLIGDFAYLSNMTPEGIDPIPIIMAVTSALYMWALASKGMLNVAPIARDYLFESMGDGVVVLDRDNRLVDYNPAAAVVIPELSPNAIGMSIEPLWKKHTEAVLVEPIASVEGEESGGADSRSLQAEVEWKINGQTFHYQIRASTVRKRIGHDIGKLMVWIDITERVRLQEQLRKQAYYDGLTGIYNRTHFMQLNESLLASAAANGEPFSILLFDIDYFKRVNDDYGHDAGDQALNHVVDICRSVLRPDDVLARYGGEEFVLAMPGLNREQAVGAAERLRAAIASGSLRLPGAELIVTASFGLAFADFASESVVHNGVQGLIKAADLALYEAKAGGRNRVKLSVVDEVYFAGLPRNVAD